MALGAVSTGAAVGGAASDAGGAISALVAGRIVGVVATGTAGGAMGAVCGCAFSGAGVGSTGTGLVGGGVMTLAIGTTSVCRTIWIAVPGISTNATMSRCSESEPDHALTRGQFNCTADGLRTASAVMTHLPEEAPRCQPSTARPAE